jgi:hypothetical protein
MIDNNQDMPSQAGSQPNRMQTQLEGLTGMSEASMALGGAAERRARDLAQLIHTGDRVAARLYIEQHYAPEFLRMPMDAHLNFIAHIHDQLRGVAILGGGEATATSTTLNLRGLSNYGMAGPPVAMKLQAHVLQDA